MSKITEAFRSGKAFIPFVTAGDPDLETTLEILNSMVKGGADIIEIGIPFSDPVAEGPVIQKADERALDAGVTTTRIFEMVSEFRKTQDIPLAFMTYINPVYVFGAERFASECKKCGVDAVIIPDIPFEEKKEISGVFDKYEVDLISLIAPTSKERIQMIANEAQGFVYCVSSMGVTGMRSEIETNVGNMVEQVKKVKDIPCAIGFGISTPEQAAQFANISDGVIVGSAIVKIVEKYGKGAPEQVYQYVKSMKMAIS